jgi:hypothetical protein
MGAFSVKNEAANGSSKAAVTRNLRMSSRINENNKKSEDVNNNNNNKYKFRETDFRLKKIKIQENMLKNTNLSKSMSHFSSDKKRSKKTVQKSSTNNKKNTTIAADVFDFTSESEDQNLDLFNKFGVKSSSKKNLSKSKNVTQQAAAAGVMLLKSNKKSQVKRLLKKEKRSYSNGASSSDTVSSSSFFEEGNSNASLAIDCVGRQSNGGNSNGISNSVASSMSTDDDNSMEKPQFNEETRQLLNNDDKSEFYENLIKT